MRDRDHEDELLVDQVRECVREVGQYEPAQSERFCPPTGDQTPRARALFNRRARRANCVIEGVRDVVVDSLVMIQRRIELPLRLGVELKH